MRIMSGPSELRTNIDTKWMYIRTMWVVGILVSFFYLISVYLLPLSGLGFAPSIPMKIIIEVIVCLFPILTGLAWIRYAINNERISIEISNEYAILSLGKHNVVTCCFEISSMNMRVELDDDNHPTYNTAMLLALRSGMADCLSMAFEAGIYNETPYLRIFLTVRGKSLSELCQILKKEATRTEAILHASITNIELKLLRENELGQAFDYLIHTNIGEDESDNDNISDNLLILFDGLPQVSPSIDRSQIGTLLSSMLKQRYSASFTCVFSKTSAKKEKRRMEREWKSIRRKEKSKDDSLADQAAKKYLIDQYDDVKIDNGWFDTTAYLHVRETKKIANRDALKGLALSIWGGDGSFKLIERKSKGRIFYRCITRRHIKRVRMHVNRLSAYVNMPVQNLPVITATPIPSFTIPSRDIIDNELKVANTVFEGRILNEVGFKVEWLREHIAVLGATGTGKTTFVKHLIAELSQKTNIPWWVFDVKGSEYHDLMGYDNVIILKPGLDSSFVIDIFDSGLDSKKRHANVVFSIFRELLKERSGSSELTPAMERLLRESIERVVESASRDANSVSFLVDLIEKAAEDDDKSGKMTRDALLNRLEILNREPLGSILAGGKNAVKISSLMNRRVIFDLRYVASTGGMDAARLLYNLVAKRIFDYAMKRGITPDLHHVVVLEEASNLVPESYTRDSAADITTGESMVMLQRATGQGVVVVSTRPNISSNILANTSSKVTFRLPYDSGIGSRFLSLNEEQERYLRVLKRGRAIMILPNTNAFEIATYPFVSPTSMDIIASEESHETESITSISGSEPGVELDDIDTSTISDQKQVFDRIGEIANHVIAFLASKRFVTEGDLLGFLHSLDSKSGPEELSELIRDLLSFESIDREAIPLVPGGFIFTIPGKGLEAVTEVIMQYILNKLENDDVIIEKKSESELVINDRAILILPEHIRATSMDSLIEKIRKYMSHLGNQVIELIIIVRGSVAAAMIREQLDCDDEFEAVTVVSAFTTSLDIILDTFSTGIVQTDIVEQSQPIIEEKITHTDLINAVRDVGSSGRAIQMRLWFGLLQDFVDVSNGCVNWDVLMEFIETTAVQSIQGRTAPMNVDDGRRALTELLADEVLVALRIGDDSQFIDLESGLWIVNSSILENMKKKSVEILEKLLSEINGPVLKNHGYYDLCAGNKSYAVFPTQQQLNTLLNLHSDVACRKCNSKEVIVILTAAEYVDDNYMTPENLTLGTMADNMSTLLI